MEINFSSKKGLFGYRLESDRADYKKLSRLATGKIYSVKATESGISVYRNGELVAEGLDRIKHQDDKTFFIGFKGEQKFIFDQVNEREMAIAHGYEWGPSFVVALDGTTYSVKNGVVFAEPRQEKTVVADNGEVSEYVGYHFTESEGGTIDLRDTDGKVVVKAATIDRNAKIMYNTAYNESKYISPFFQVRETERIKLINEKTGKVFYETDASHKISTNGGEKNSCAAIVDYDPASQISRINVFDKKDTISRIVEVPGWASYITIDKETDERVVKHLKPGATGYDHSYTTFSGVDVTQKIQKQIDDEWEYYRRLGAERSREIQARREREEQKAMEEADEAARSHETANILMGASLMGLGMPATGSTVIATTMIARHKREQAKRAREEGENSSNRYTYSNDEAEFGDE